MSSTTILHQTSPNGQQPTLFELPPVADSPIRALSQAVTEQIHRLLAIQAAFVHTQVTGSPLEPEIVQDSYQNALDAMDLYAALKEVVGGGS